MGDEEGLALKQDGIHIGDFVLRPVPAMSTDDHLDTPEGRERVLRKEQDERAARAGGVTGSGHPIADPLHPAPVPVLPVGAGGDVDASIDAARSATEGEPPDDPTIPILLRDPLTGKIIGSV